MPNKHVILRLHFKYLFIISILLLSISPLILPPPLQSQDAPETTPTLTETAAETPTETPTLTETATFTVEPTITPTLPETPTETPTAELSPTATLPETPTETATSELLTPTLTETLTETPTETLTPTTPPFGTEPPLSLIFTDNFDSGDTTLWTLGAGWSFVASESGQALQSTSDEAVTFANNNVADAAAEARFLLPSALARLSLRQSEAGSYTALMDVSGNIVLYRGGEQMGTALVSPVAPGQWRTLRLSTIGDIVRVAIDGVEVIAAQDSTPLPPGTISFAGMGASGLLVDDFGLWVIGGIVNTPTQTPIAMPPDPPTPTPTSTISPNDAFEDSLAIMGFVSPSEPYAVVSNLADFIDAINAANNSSVPYSIFVKKEESGSSYFIPSRINIGSSSVPRNIRIYGLGSEVSVIDSGITGDTLFYVHTGSTLRLKDLTLTGGDGGVAYGGMIVNYGTLTLDGVVARNNAATHGGGVIYTYGTSTIHNTFFIMNSSPLGRAGAIWNGGTLNISCTGFQANSTLLYGGALYTVNPNTSISVVSSVFTGNTILPSPPPPTPSFGLGGAIYRNSDSSVSANGNFWSTWNGAIPGATNLNVPGNTSTDTLTNVTVTSVQPSNPMLNPALCPTSPRTIPPTFEQELADYGITITEAEWPGYTSAVREGVHNTAIALAIQSLSVPSTDDAPRATFKRVMLASGQTLIFERGDVPDGPVCITTPEIPKIKCDPQNITTHYTITHELGHLFNRRAGGSPDGSGSLYDRLDESGSVKDYRLIKSEVVFGTRILTDRSQDWWRGTRGWGGAAVTPWSCTAGGEEPSHFQQNPCNQTGLGIEEVEEAAADMFLNWAYQKQGEGGFLNCTWDTVGANLNICVDLPDGNDGELRTGDVRFDWMTPAMASIFTQRTW
jgi:hypothetical protein